jgi:hypothetical protein
LHGISAPTESKVSASQPVPQPVPALKVTPAVDEKSFSDLQKKVQNLEIATDSLKQKSKEITEKSTSKNGNEKIFSEIQSLNDKIVTLEKDNMQRINEARRGESVVNAMSAEDIIEETKKKEEISGLQEDIKKLQKLYENIERLEQSGKVIQKKGTDTADSLVVLTSKLSAVEKENQEMKKMSLESPSSIDQLNGAVSGFAARYAYCTLFLAFIYPTSCQPFLDFYFVSVFQWYYFPPFLSFIMYFSNFFLLLLISVQIIRSGAIRKRN